MSKEFDMIAFLWDQVKNLSEKARQHDGQVQIGYSAMCKLENKGMISHLKKEPKTVPVSDPEVNSTAYPIDVDSGGNTAPLPIENETIVEPVPIPALEPEPEVVEEVIEEVVEEIKPFVPAAGTNEKKEKPIEADNVDELLEQYKKAISENK